MIKKGEYVKVYDYDNGETIVAIAISDEYITKDKKHKVIIMFDNGDLSVAIMNMNQQWVKQNCSLE